MIDGMGWDGMGLWGWGNGCAVWIGLWGGMRERMRGVVGDHWGNEIVIYHLRGVSVLGVPICSGAALI